MTRGGWLQTSFYEVPTLAIVNEVYFRMSHDYDQLIESFEKKLDEKIQWLIDGKYHIGNFSEFGLRRRLSSEAQELAVSKLAEANDRFHKEDGKWSNLVGTSNVYLARKHGLEPMGTMAHEIVMGIGQSSPRHNPSYSNYYTMRAWVKEYGVQNGIMLTDTITTDCFLRDFGIEFATLYSGVRHDSSCPRRWADKMIAHYKKLGINPMTKTLLFSDSLDFSRANDLFETYSTQAMVAFGIGTYISNDTDVAKPLNIVMKPIMANGMALCKLSDSDGKNMCRDQEYVDYLKRCIKWRMEHE
jgi:nicotinate phosphoribosyltransferase